MFLLVATVSKLCNKYRAGFVALSVASDHEPSMFLQVAFVPNTHYAFTVGKDGAVKYWDADRWELLLTLEGHKAEVCS